MFSNPLQCCQITTFQPLISSKSWHFRSMKIIQVTLHLWNCKSISRMNTTKERPAAIRSIGLSNQFSNLSLIQMRVQREYLCFLRSAEKTKLIYLSKQKVSEVWHDVLQKIIFYYKKPILTWKSSLFIWVTVEYILLMLKADLVNVQLQMYVSH